MRYLLPWSPCFVNMKRGGQPCPPKAALRNFARTLAAELIGRNIRINAVSPGVIAEAALSSN